MPKQCVISLLRSNCPNLPAKNIQNCCKINQNTEQLKHKKKLKAFLTTFEFVIQEFIKYLSKKIQINE